MFYECYIAKLCSIILKIAQSFIGQPIKLVFIVIERGKCREHIVIPNVPDIEVSLNMKMTKPFSGQPLPLGC